MKRFYIILALLAICVAISVYTIRHVSKVTDRIFEGVDGAIHAIANADEQSLRRHVIELTQFWDEEEDRIIHLVRHAQVDEMTKSFARLRALMEGKEYTELTAELESIRWQMDHVNRSERMVFSNLLTAKQQAFPFLWECLLF